MIKYFIYPIKTQKPLLNKLLFSSCLLYTSDAADERSSVDLGGRRIIKKKKYWCNAETSSIKDNK